MAAFIESLGLSNWLLLLSALVTIGYQAFFFFIAAFFRFDKVTDLAGGTNFVIVAVLVFLLGPVSEIPIDVTPRQWYVTVAVLLWGIRLSGFLFYRILVTEEDKRFDGIREDLFKFGLFWCFQACWVWIVSLPVIFINAQDSRASLFAADYFFWTAAAVGLITEAVADNQKFAWRQRNLRANVKEPFIRHGLWALSRHPNYFGELLFWWSIFGTVSQSFLSPIGYYTLASPLFVSYLLLGASGMPILEFNANVRLGSNSDYLSYIRDTSPLIPMPPCLYRKCIPMVKAILLFEWPIFRRGLDDSAVLLAIDKSTAISSAVRDPIPAF